MNNDLLQPAATIVAALIAHNPAWGPEGDLALPHSGDGSSELQDLFVQVYFSLEAATKKIVRQLDVLDPPPEMQMHVLGS